MSTRPDLAGVLAEHPPTYTEYATDPTTTFHCAPCSEAAGDWVTWTPSHITAALDAAIDAWLADEGTREAVARAISAEIWWTEPGAAAEEIRESIRDEARTALAALTTPTPTEPEEGKR